MLYFVATPIGNLKDVSFRAIEILNLVDEIACEDTRHSAIFLNHYNIKKPLFAYHKFNEKEICEKIVEKLKNGKNLAVISDAGTPVISDPGNVLVKKLIEENLEFTIIPGACALISAYVLSGFSDGKFCFLGFMPQKATERKEFLQKYSTLDLPLIFYCAPHDIVKDVQSIYEVFGDRQAVAVKEITKIHEKAEHFQLKNGFSSEPKGEYVLIVDKCEQQNFSNTLGEKEHIEMYLKRGLDKKEALKLVAKERGVSKSSLYKWTIED